MAADLEGSGPGPELVTNPTRREIFTVHATRADRMLVTHRIIPDVAVAQAQQLKEAGWRVHITGLGGREFGPAEFYQLLTYKRIG